MNAKLITIAAVMIALIVGGGLSVGGQPAPTTGPAGDEYMGGLIWNNWTLTMSGGTGELPPGV
ncbi:MAG: hypothetical protein JRC86_11350, partial [Deltaproteobacteria bacterium]|nr:hypothetical protein [Deltaproteobacteria bacterium]